MEQIFIEKLEVFGHHGVYEQEKEDGQFFLVDCLCDVSFKEAVATDNLSNTTDYGTMCLFIKKYFDESAMDLLETVADQLSTAMLYAFPGIHKIELSICKPNAPIPMDFQGVGVKIMKEWIPVAISIGSNMGDRELYLTTALEELVAHPAIRNLVVSDYMETKPYGYENQDDFLNGAATFDTLLSPDDLLDFLHEIENHGNRERKIHWGPRTIDLDILLYGDMLYNTKDLIIPHLDMCNREFVLKPLVSIAPGMVHPVRRRNIYDLYHSFKTFNKKDE